MKTLVVMQPGRIRDELGALLDRAGWQVLLYDSLRELLSADTPAERPDLIIAELKIDDKFTGRYCTLLRYSDLSSLHDVPLLMCSHLYNPDYGTTVARSIGADSYVQLSGNNDVLVERAVELAADTNRNVTSSSVLCIDDDPVLLKIMKTKFSANRWTVDTAHSVAEGLKILRTRRYDLVIIDYHLPDGKGDRLLQEVVRESPESTTLMVTADVNTDLAVRWLDMGASAYLLKPFSVQYLYETGMRCLHEKMWHVIELQLNERTSQLKQREALVKDFEDAVGDAIWRRDADLRYSYISPSIENITGLSAIQTLDLSLEEEMTPESARRFRELVWKAQAQRGGQRRKMQQQGVFDLICRNGTTATVEISFFLKPGKNGKYDELLGSTKDRTDEKEKETQFASFYSAVNQAEEIIMVTDSEGRLQFANNSFSRVTGYDPMDWVGQDENILTMGLDDRDSYCAVSSAITNGFSWSGEINSKRKDGTSYPERVKIIPIRDREQDVSQFVVVKHDLSQELELVHEKNVIEEKYFHAQRLEAIGILAMGIIHDFNNILTPIVGYANLIKLKYRDDFLLQDHVDKILIAGERAKDLVKQVLLFSRGSEKKLEPLNLQPLIKESIKMVRAFLPSKITVSTDIKDSAPVVIIDPTKFSQLFMNLVTNSFHAMESKGGSLEIMLKRREKDGTPCVELRIKDSGPGIPKEVMPRVFDPFVTTKEEGKGTGLGLSVCKTIAEEAGGSIEIEKSSEKTGTVVLVRLPVFLTDKKKKRAEKALSRRFDGKGEHVLLVDDDEIVLDYLTAALRRLNFSVQPFIDSRDALQEFNKNGTSYLLAFTDIEMPNKDGIELIGNLRSIRQGLPIVVCTGNTMPGLDRALEPYDNIALLNKPVTVDDVSEALFTLSFDATLKT